MGRNHELGDVPALRQLILLTASGADVWEAVHAVHAVHAGIAAVAAQRYLLGSSRHRGRAK
jgi:hypothetical protein